MFGLVIPITIHILLYHYLTHYFTLLWYILIYEISLLMMSTSSLFYLSIFFFDSILRFVCFYSFETIEHPTSTKKAFTRSHTTQNTHRIHISHCNSLPWITDWNDLINSDGFKPKSAIISIIFTHTSTSILQKTATSSVSQMHTLTQIYAVTVYSKPSHYPHHHHHYIVKFMLIFDEILLLVFP